MTVRTPLISKRGDVVVNASRGSDAVGRDSSRTAKESARGDAAYIIGSLAEPSFSGKELKELAEVLKFQQLGPFCAPLDNRLATRLWEEERSASRLFTKSGARTTRYPSGCGFGRGVGLDNSVGGGER
jgi:hypothetical protein